jgi:hypothetical protein
MIASDWATETIARTLRTDRVGVRTSGITGSVVPFPANLEAVGLIGTALSLWRGAFGRQGRAGSSFLPSISGRGNCDAASFPPLNKA